jgi:hypothetical protein
MAAIRWEQRMPPSAADSYRISGEKGLFSPVSVAAQRLGTLVRHPVRIQSFENRSNYWIDLFCHSSSRSSSERGAEAA